MPTRRLLRIALLVISAAGCESGNTALVTLSSDGPVDQYDLYVRDETSHTILKHTGWAAFNRDITTSPFKIGLQLPATGTYSVVIVGSKGPTDGIHPAKGSGEFFWATTVTVSGTLELSATLLHVPDGDDMDQDIFPDSMTWKQHLPEAAGIPGTLLDCDDKTDYPMKKVFAAQINPFAPEICGDGVDEDCNGDMDETCVDRDGDGDPDSSDCKPDDPKIHHPNIDSTSPHYDPYPQSPNCCGYNLGKTGADANKSFATDPICHAGTCDNGIDEDCSGKDIACVADQDCDQFRAATKEDNACMAPADKDQTSANLDCDDCNPAINPNAAEICDGLDNNCNGATDETCVTCDLDGDSFQRMDVKNGCPDAKYVQSGKPLDCDDEDAGVFPGSTSMTYPVKLPYLQGALATCGGTIGGTVCGALRTLCKNLKTDGVTPQDANCDSMPTAGCPPANCDADGDGFIDSAKAAQCDPMGKLLPYDCDDTDPQTFPQAPAKCAEAKPHNCNAITTCPTDGDKDGYDANNDCNDNDPTVHPWATELCDGVDNDCDGLTDERNPDETGAPMVTMGHITFCTDSDVGECAKAPLGHCVCSASPVSNLHFEPNKRTICPGETPAIDAAAGSKARCYGAQQPGKQSCNPAMPLDDDCDGRVDAPDGKNFPQVGMPCWPGAVGQCAPAKGGNITGCDMTKTNCFAAAGRIPNAWLTCDNTEICPVPEKCNGFDDDCNSNIPVNETDVDGDGYVACGSPFPMYTSNQVCEMMLMNGILGCGDCADSVGFTMGVANNQIHPGQADICDGVDNDCNPPTPDGNADCPGPKPAEICCAPQGGCKDPANDVNNCNGCNIACNLFQAVPICVTSACAIKSCNAPFLDCDKAPGNGCEINSNTDQTHCGACLNNCSGNNMATITCGGGICNGTCAANFLDCDGNKLTNGCEINSQNDATHCGACGNNCSGANIAAPTCGAGICNGACNAGFLDCNGNKLADGCEINGQTDQTHCGACANNCSNNNIAAPTCAGGVCNGNCNVGFADCDGNKLANGCEINTNTNAAHCGACPNNCSNNNIAVPTCGGGVCNGTCNAGFFDCDGSKLGDGCELDGRTDPNNCGGCAISCSAQNMATRTCGGGICNGTCNGGFFDCNGNKQSDGCELDGHSDPNNCGGCGSSCSANNMLTRTCANQICNGTCNTNFFDCNVNKKVDGCELDGRTDPNNCGGCATVCSNINMQTRTCAAGICNGTCTAGFFDCDVNKQTDGCELDGRTDVLNCGGCGTVCSTINIARACAAQSCNAGVCNAGFFDCDGNKQVDGCELDGRTDVFNCGGCNKVCSGNNMMTVSCAAQVCNGTCLPNFADCINGKQVDGCETNTQTDANNCGGCTIACSNNNMMTRTCGAGACNGTCLPNFADCINGKQVDGCETNTQTDKDNCGGCTMACSNNNMMTRTCGAGVCNGTCLPGFADCINGKLVDGCETNTTNDKDNCGGCGMACSNNNMMTRTCGSSLCNGACLPNFADCINGKLVDGCETDITTVANCGSCGNDCSNKANGHLCLTGACGCNTDADCGVAKPACNVGTHLCQVCVTDADCSPATPVCSGGTSCVACTGGMASTCTSGGWGNACGPPCSCMTNPDCSNPRVDTCNVGNTCICMKTGTVCPVGKTCSGAGCN